MLGLDHHADRHVVLSGVPDHDHQFPQGDQLALLGFWIRNPSGAEIDQLEFRDRALIRRARAGRGPVQGQIVQADELVIGAEMHVALQPEGISVSWAQSIAA